MVVTIDGPAGAGKTTLAKSLAQALGWIYLESGALYRAVALAVLRGGIEVDDVEAVGRLMDRLDLDLALAKDEVRIFLGHEEVTDFLRAEEVGRTASAVSRLRVVRSRLNELQRRIGARGGVVVEGRDAGSVVFPQARLKFYLSASPRERAQRRAAQLAQAGVEADLDVVSAEMAARDQQDQTRDLAPLKPPPDSLTIDTTGLSPSQILAMMLAEVDKALA